MTHHAHTPTIADRLARYYTEALAKNPKATIHENMAWAVEQMPIVSAAEELLEALQKIAGTVESWEGDEPKELVFFLEELAYAAIAKATGGAESVNKC